MDIAKSTRVGLAKFDKTQVWLANKLGVTRQHICQVCKGKSSVSLSSIELLAKTFGVSVSQFIQWGE
jgi:plasmid maintenance system antidote protein VapI